MLHKCPQRISTTYLLNSFVPFGDILGLHGEFIPASKHYLNDYIQYATSDFFGWTWFRCYTKVQLLEKNEKKYTFELAESFSRNKAVSYPNPIAIPINGVWR